MYMLLKQLSLPGGLVTGLPVWISLFALVGCGAGSLETKHAPVTIAQVKTLCEGQREWRAVTFQGVVTLVDPPSGFIVLQDATAGIRVRPSKFVDLSLTGHRVEVKGGTSPDGDADAIVDASIKDLGKAPAPEPIRLSASDLKKDRFDDLLVRLRGVPRSLHVNSTGQGALSIQVTDVQMNARVMDDRQPLTSRLLDAEVDATGVASTAVDVDNRVTDFTLLIPATQSIAILKEAPGLQTLPFRSVQQLWNSGEPPSHRIRLRGAVYTASSSELRFLDSSGSLPIRAAAGAELFSRGDVDIVAFARKNGSGIVLEEARSLDAGATRHERLDSAPAVLTSAAAVHGLSRDRGFAGAARISRGRDHLL